MSLRVQNNRNDARSFTTLFCNNPVTGIRRSVLLSHRGAISSHCFRVLFAGRTYEHLTMRSLSVYSGRPLLVPAMRYRIICLCSIFLDKKANKKPFIPHPGRRALLFTLVLPPAFTNISRYQPQQVCTFRTHFYPITGASGEFYSHAR
jgi:hypothetical protein